MVDPLMGTLDLVRREPTLASKVGPVMWKTSYQQGTERMVETIKR
jgi:hypothetical protein